MKNYSVNRFDRIIDEEGNDVCKIESTGCSNKFTRTAAKLLVNTLNNIERGRGAGRGVNGNVNEGE